MHRFLVPVIAVFTKFDQFLRNVKMYLEDYGNPDDNLSDAVESQFNEHYLTHLGEGARFVQLESPFSIKYGGRALIRCDRNAQDRNTLHCSSGRDSESFGYRCGRFDVVGCAEGEFGTLHQYCSRGVSFSCKVLN